MENTWRTRAACIDHNPELFFPVGSTDTALINSNAAKTICHSCVVVVQCLDWALETNQECGIYGGLDEDERQILRRLKQKRNQIA